MVLRYLTIFFFLIYEYTIHKLDAIFLISSMISDNVFKWNKKENILSENRRMRVSILS